MNARLILNDGARLLTRDVDRVTMEKIKDAFRDVGIHVDGQVAPAGRLTEALLDAIAARPDAIFVGGGDGTISTAAGSLAGTHIALGVLPLGTLNHFARDLGLPTAWDAAVQALARGEIRALDVGEVNGRVFINNCSLGSYADAVRKREALRRSQQAGKWWAMLRATLTVFRRLRRIRVRITADEATVPLRSPFVVIANNRYSGRVLNHSMRPRLDEGRLWIYSTRARRHAAILRFFWQALLRELDAVDGLEKFEVTNAVIDHDYTGLPVAVDGELVALRPPLHVCVRPGALRVITPQRAAVQ